MLPLALAIAPWTLLLSAPHHHNRGWLAAVNGLIVLASLLVLAKVLIPSTKRRVPDEPGRKNLLPTGWYAFVGFALTFIAFIGAYASLDLTAVTTNAHCFEGSNGAPLDLKKLDSVYYAITTLSTTGFGDISAQTHICRRLVIGEMTIAFPVFGLAIAGVAAAIWGDRERLRAG